MPSWTAFIRTQAHKSKRGLRLTTLVATVCWYLKRFFAHEALQLRIRKNAGIIPEPGCRRKQRGESSTPGLRSAPDAYMVRAFRSGFQRDYREMIAKVRSMLEEVSRLLSRIDSSGSFATRRSAAAEDLNLEVRGVGRIRFPVSPATARKLADVSRPARHGFKDQTRLDRRVRDTWEIPKSRITIDELRWKKTLTPQLDRIRRDLGLPDGRRLKAQLHNDGSSP